MSRRVHRFLTAIAVAFLACLPAARGDEPDLPDDMPPPSTLEFRAWFDARVQTALAEATFPRAATRFVSSSLGDDKNAGDSPSAPWRTLAQVRLWLATSGTETRCVRFRRGDVFRDIAGIDTTLPGIHFADYGDPAAPLPRLSGFTAVWPAGGAKKGGWQVDPKLPAFGWRTVDRAVFWVRQDGDADLEQPLIRASNIESARTRTGSWFYDAQISRLYVHARGSVPITSVLLEGATATGPGIAVAGDLSLVENLRAEGWGMNENSREPFASYACGTTRTVFRNLVAYYSERHCIAHTCNLSGGFALVMDCTAGRPSPTFAGQSIFNSYTQRGGSQAIFLRCSATHNTLPSDAPSFLDASLPVYAHTSSPYYFYNYLIVSDLRYGDSPARPTAWPLLANMRFAPSLDKVRAVIMDTRVRGVRGADAWARNAATINCDISTLGAQVNCRCGQSSEADGWLINSVYELDLAGGTSGLYGFLNSNGDNGSRTYHSALRLRNVPPGSTVQWDFDGPFASFDSRIHNSVIDNGGYYLDLNIWAGSAPIRANGYVDAPPHPFDPYGVAVAGPYQPDSAVPAGSVLVGRGIPVQEPEQIEYDAIGRPRTLFTIGPREYFPTCVGDIDGDHDVSATDLAALLAAWGNIESNYFADLNGDGEINALDLAALLSSWGDCP
ncbi:MAG: dockerin type I domain-containing protein [Planctomycetota bacterium]